MSKTLICGSLGAAQKLDLEFLASSKIDPKRGALCSFKDIILAYYDQPTLNNVIFPRKLWEKSKEDVKDLLANGSFWGEDQHRDSDQVFVENVACRVTDFRIADDNLVLGDVDILDTPRGRVVHSLLLTGGAIGLSSRGYGELYPVDAEHWGKYEHAQWIEPDSYVTVCWDVVTIPAVPQALMQVSSSSGAKSGEGGGRKIVRGVIPKIRSARVKPVRRES